MYKFTPNSLWSGAFQFPCKIQKHKIGMRVPARVLFWVLRPNRVKRTQPLRTVNPSLQNTQLPPVNSAAPHPHPRRKKKKRYCAFSTKLKYCENSNQNKYLFSSSPFVPRLTELSPTLTILTSSSRHPHIVKSRNPTTVFRSCRFWTPTPCQSCFCSYHFFQTGDLI